MSDSSKQKMYYIFKIKEYDFELDSKISAWCLNTFGVGDGGYQKKFWFWPSRQGKWYRILQLDRDHLSEVLFGFHKEPDAAWFLLKWGEYITC